MEDRAADEPDEDVESSREARIEHAADGVDHERERERGGRRGAAGRRRSGSVRARSRRHPGQARDPLRAVHAGQRGHDDARRVAVVERQVGAVDAQREQRALVECWAWPSVARRRTPRGCRDSTRRTAPAGAPASAARSRRRTPLQRCVVDQPSTHAIGRSCSCCSMASSCALESSRRSLPAIASRQSGPGQRRRDAGGGGGLVDREAVGPVVEDGLAARRQQREAPQRTAGRLPDRHHAAGRADAPATSASRPRRLIVGAAGVGGARLPGSCGSARVRRRSARNGASTPRSRYARTMTGSLIATWMVSAARKTHAP